jgi:flagellar motor switch protein FliN/FliY
MEQALEEVLETFVERWLEEFGRAVQMFTGEEATLSSSRGKIEDEAETMAGSTWWKQVVKNQESFSIWAGGVEAAWSAMGEGAEAQSTFFEMVSQANQGAAAVLSAGFPIPLKCEDGLIEAPPPRSDLELCKIKISFRGNELPPLLLLIEPVAFRILNPSDEDEPEAGPVSTGQTQHPAILNRLMGLQLPVSILLGRTAMRIKDVMKITPGSVIELDREIGDYVEIMVHGTVVARGEIVSVKGNYGVRIKEIISRQDRIALHEAA